MHGWTWALTELSRSRSISPTGLAKTLLACLLLALVFTSPAPTHAAYPGTNGSIIFEALRDGRFQTFTTGPSGGAETPFAPTLGNNFHPRYSGDGQTVAFISDRDGSSQIYTASANGSGVTRRTLITGSKEWPALSPDGSLLAFGNNDGGVTQLYVISAGAIDAPAPLTLTAGHSPRFSPDGTRILFYTDADQVRTIHPDGTNLTTLFSPGARPDWSPDGTKITFQRNLQIWTANTDGTAAVQVSSGGPIDDVSIWSPDGTKLLFRSNRTGPSKLYVMQADGSDAATPTAITSGTGAEQSMDWQCVGCMVVTTLADNLTADGQCSLREAMTNANNDAATHADCAAGAGADTITFNLSGTIVLGSTLPVVTSAAGLSIDGTGQTVTISGNNAVRVLGADPGSVLTLRKLTIANGSLATDGAGLWAGGTTTIIDSTFSGNAAGTEGGAIVNVGTLTVTNSTFSGNTAGTSGGALRNAVGATLTITGTTISGNSAPAGSGGGLANQGSVTVQQSTIQNNTAQETGGGIGSSGAASQLMVTDTRIAGNTTNSSGGGIYAGGPATVNRSTISGNQATFSGGGVYNVRTGIPGAMNVTNSTLSGNTAGAQGSAIRNDDAGMVSIHNTIAGTVFNNGPSTLSLSGTIIESCSGGTTTSVGHNLSSTATCNLTQLTDLPNTNPLLGPLANNGGPTQTQALLPASPALGKADSAVCAAAPVNGVDQRGVARPAGNGCDIGAYESDAVAGGKNLKITTGSVDLSWDGGTVQADYLVARAQLIPAGPTTFSAPLPANTTSYTDPAPPSLSLLCYQVIPRDGVGTVLGLSDFDCAYTGFAGGTVVPSTFTLGLNQSPNATLTWTAPAGGPVDGYALYKLPFDGSPITFEGLGAGQTSSVQDMGATHYCYTLVAFRGAAFGNTNLVCGIQGFSSLSRTANATPSVGATMHGLQQTLGDLDRKVGNLANKLGAFRQEIDSSR